MEPRIWDLVVIALLATAVPYFAVRSFRRLRKAVDRGDPRARLRAYRTTAIQEWSFTLLLVLAWGLSGRSWGSLGFALPGDLRFGTAAGLVGLCVLGLALQSRVVARSEAARAQVREQIGPVEYLLPAERRELQRFMALSLTAGICEEVVYRGYVMAVLNAFGGAALAVVGSTLLFALGHVYQGRGVAKVAVVGLVAALLYLLGRSLWPVIVLHAALDAFAGWTTWQARNAEEGATSPAA